MRSHLNLLPILVFLLVSPLAAQAPNAATHFVRTLRAGQGQARARITPPARPASERLRADTGSTVRIRPYQVPKPGEGAPKT